MSLGSLFYEPVWLFYREASAQRASGKPVLESFADMARPGDWKLNIGAPGSGVPNLVKRLLEANRVDAGALTLVQKPSTPAVVALLEGEIDALVFASAPESPLVQMLLQTPGVKLFDFPQAEAYSRRFTFLSAVTLPRGVVDLARDMPSANIRMIAPTATLVAKETLHPALVQLFVQAARQIHGGRAGSSARHLPSIENTERTLAPEAERFYRNGAPLLQRYLPFWIANLIDRMWVVMVSIIAILIPLSRVVPPLYQFRVRSRIFRWYGQLRRLEDSVAERPLPELLSELDGLEDRAGRIHVPLSYADELYALRSNIHMVRRRLQGMSPEPRIAAWTPAPRPTGHASRRRRRRWPDSGWWRCSSLLRSAPVGIPARALAGRQWLSGFSGSMGTLVVARDKAALFADSRYWVQAEAELAGSGIELVKIPTGTATHHVDWLARGAKAGDTVAVDGDVLGLAAAQQLRAALEKVGATLRTDLDVLAEVWPDRPALPAAPVYEHRAPMAPLAPPKLAQLREAMAATAPRII